MKVDIVIPNYNGAHLIERNLPYVLESLKKYEGFVIIVDDGSTPDDKKKLQELTQGYENVKYQEHIKNKGFSSAVKTGVSLSNAEFVVLLNSDVVPSKNFLESPLSKLTSDPKLFAVGCMDESIEGSNVVLRGRGIGKWSRGMVVHSRGEVDRDDTFWVSGGSCIIRRQAYEQLGGMDEIYNPFYWEDIDLSFRARKSGYTILFDKNSTVKHYHEEGAIKSNFSQKKITTVAYRNQFVFVWKNITSVNFLLQHFIFLPVHVLLGITNGDINILKGVFLALLLLPAIIKKRKKQKRFYEISDELLFN